MAALVPGSPLYVGQDDSERVQLAERVLRGAIKSQAQSKRNLKTPACVRFADI